MPLHCQDKVIGVGSFQSFDDAVIGAAALGVGNAITLEAGLSFLGLGVQPPAPSWGGMIASGRDTLVNAPWVAIAPGVALVLVVVACTLVGDALRDGAVRGDR
jgi:peptide/nickel transport system permease protein